MPDLARKTRIGTFSSLLSRDKSALLTKKQIIEVSPTKSSDVRIVSAEKPFANHKIMHL